MRKLLEKRLAWTTANRKKCPRCLKVKPLDQFKPRKPSGSISYCYSCSLDYYKSYNKKRYSTPEAQEAERVRTKNKYQTNVKPQRIERKKELIKNFGGKCQKCGYCKNAAALDFHHIEHGTKQRTLGALLASAGLFEDAIEEARKCELLCSNCHREETFPDWIMPKEFFQ